MNNGGGGDPKSENIFSVYTDGSDGDSDQPQDLGFPAGVTKHETTSDQTNNQYSSAAK